MLAAGVIAFREGLEAALIIGIVMGYLVKIGQARHIRLAWLGVVAAIVLSVVMAVGINLWAGSWKARPSRSLKAPRWCWRC